MRGKVTLQDVPCDSVGITPAYAGKSKRRALPALSPGDHPRVCGEKATETDRPVCWVGSPPCMRGKVRHAAAGDQAEGVTPAHAGKSDGKALRIKES